MKATIGITGGTGYVGSSLAKKLSLHFDIILLDTRTPKVELPRNVSFKKCDITNADEVRDALENVDLVIHTAIIQIPLINEEKELGYEVNVIGTQNVCKVASESKTIKGLLLSGSWHTMGEKELSGVINEEFGFRPDKVEERARLYALSKMAQESIVRFYDEMTCKIFGIIRMGTVLGEGMPEKTAANIFIENGFSGKALTPFKQSMYRPMLYVDIEDICRAYDNFAKKILNGQIRKNGNSILNIFNVYYPEPITIIELAGIVRDSIINLTQSKIQPELKIIDNGQPSIFNENDKNRISIEMSKALSFLELGKLKNPQESIEELVRKKLDSSLS